MAALVKLKATKPLRYASRALAVGEEFEATYRDAKILQAIRKAEILRVPGKVAAPPARVVDKVAKAAPVVPETKETPEDIADEGDQMDSAVKGIESADFAVNKDPVDELATVRAEYERVLGKKPWNGWDVETLRTKIKDAAGS